MSPRRPGPLARRGLRPLTASCLLLALAIAFIAAWRPARAPAQPSEPERRIALVIGIGEYQSAPALANPVNDARAIGEALRRLNFEVEELFDADFRRLTRGVREFGIRAQRADVALVYYAGHGVQVGRENFLIPADARLERERDLLYEAMPLELLLGEVSQARKIGIVLLDACRNSPFVDRMSRSMRIVGRAAGVSQGLARVDNVPRNTMVVMATKADQIAEDGDGQNSPFAAALLAHFQIPGLELSLFFRSVRDTVLRATGNRQEPYVFSSLGAEPFYFYPRPPNRPPVIGPVPPLEVSDIAGPTPVGIPRPTDPDQDPLTVRITGLPRAGEVRVEGRSVTPGAVFSADRFATATYKPDGKVTGPVGTLDVLVEDGRGGNALASLAVTVIASNRPPTVEAPRRLRIYTGPLEIAPPADPDGDALTAVVRILPRGVVRNGEATVRTGDRLQSAELAGLTFLPEPGFAGPAGSLQYQVEDGRGGRAEGTLEIEVMGPAEAAAQMAETALWERLRTSGRPEDLDVFLRIYPESRYAAAARRRRDELTAPVASAPRAGPQPALAQQPAQPPPQQPAPHLAQVQRPAPEAEPVVRRGAEPPPASQDGRRAATVDQIASLRPPQMPQPPAPSEAVALPLPPPPASEPPPAEVPTDGAGFRDCPNCPVMVRIPGGAFTMGQGARDPAAMPAHRVTIRAFAMGQYPITVSEWRTCLAEAGCGFLPRMVVADDRTPVHNVSWDDAQQYISWLSRKTGKPYRLPTEAEWEYAARGGTTTRYWWGDQIGVALANCADCGGRQDARGPLPVDGFRPNPFGLHGMLGGVAQWTADCWFPNYHGAPADGSARETRSCIKRVLRGGSFRSGHEDITPASRGNYDGPVRYLLNGFRVARDLD